MTDYFHLDAAPDHIRAISNLGLAHLGDAVFEVMVRSWLCLRGKATSKGLHRATVHFVAAPAQAAMAEKILPLLSEEEGDVFRRGRNASPHSCLLYTSPPAHGGSSSASDGKARTRPHRYRRRFRRWRAAPYIFL